MSPTSKKKTTVKKSVKKKIAKKKVAKKKSASTKKTAAKKATKKAAESYSLDITGEERWKMIAVAAYHKAEKRNFTPGNELRDWTEAEKEVDKILNG